MADNKAHVLLAKQPIFDAQKNLFAHELLFRTPLQLAAWEVGEDQATSEVLVNYATSVTAEADDAGHPLFINVSESFVLSEAFLPVDKNLVVIEILERAEVTPAFVQAVKNWRQRGYRFALDDFDFDARWEPLIPLAHYIKVDILDADLDEVAQQKARFDHLQKVRWIAERIEDQDTLNRCAVMGFDLFQGYVLARPKEVLGNSIRASSAMTAQIIKKASEPQAKINDIADLVSQDPKLTMQLLKLINSSLFTLPREIRDLKKAITFLGVDILKQWALMIAFVADALAPLESCRLILARAKCCEMLVRDHHRDKELADSAFLAGLLSGVDLLLHIEPRGFVQSLQLSRELQDALLNNTGELNTLLTRVTEIEYCAAQSPDALREVPAPQAECYLEAQRWAAEVIDNLARAS